MTNGLSRECFDAGQWLVKQRKIARALDCFDQAQQLGYSACECAGARWHCWMLSGCFERAWKESDLIAAAGAPHPEQLWKGEPWDGKRVVLRCLHGLGDTIQFIRYAPQIASCAKSVAVQVHPQLVTLLEGVPGIKRVFSWREESRAGPAEWDMQMEVTELPRAFRTTATTVPGDIPYIELPQERRAWALGIVGKARGFRVGLVWESGPWNSARSIPFPSLNPILEIPGVDFCAFQKGFQLDPGISVSLRNPEMHADDVRDTAALMQQMDLIITVDTMSAHLAGALGLPVWILLPFEADWRWMIDRDDTPWYQTARLFRQVHPGDWDAVVRQVAEDLRSISA